jgi:hypothetical protein
MYMQGMSSLPRLTEAGSYPSTLVLAFHPK